MTAAVLTKNAVVIEVSDVTARANATGPARLPVAEATVIEFVSATVVLTANQRSALV